MSRRCTICTSPKAAEINRALVAGDESFRHAAARFDTSTGALVRHKRHLPAKLVKAAAAREEHSAGSLLDRLAELTRESQAILVEARRTRDHDIALKAISRLEKQLELAARLLGELKADGPAAVIYVAELRHGRGAVEPVIETRALEAKHGK